MVSGWQWEWARLQWRRWGRLGLLALALLLLLRYFAASGEEESGLGDSILRRLPLLPRPAQPASLASVGISADVAVNQSSSSSLAALANDSSPDPATKEATSEAQTLETSPDVAASSSSPSPESSPSSVTSSASSSTTSTTPVPSTEAVDNSTGLVAQPRDLEDCPVIPPALVGPIKVWFDYPSWSELERLYASLEPGGHGKPAQCKARHRVAIIVPYRDRDKHLRGFLHNLHSLLSKQQLDYAIVVVEQAGGQTFNRGKLMNVGFVEARALYDFQCFIFHDVDLFPEDDRNIYSCPDQPRHMSVAVDKFAYRLPYSDIFGGISALRREHFEKINGVSNDFWGWGGEDDDFASRVRLEGFRISRYPSNIARYKMIKHVTEKDNPVNKCRFTLINKTKGRYKKDGLSSLNYTRLELSFRKLYTHVLVDLHEAQGRAELRRQHLCQS